MSIDFVIFIHLTYIVMQEHQQGISGHRDCMEEGDASANQRHGVLGSERGRGTSLHLTREFSHCFAWQLGKCTEGKRGEAEERKYAQVSLHPNPVTCH